MIVWIRCARNCFQCPICQNTLSVVAAQEATPSATPASAGPYFLACNVCRWNSKEINMTFEKPTSLAREYRSLCHLLLNFNLTLITIVQLQKTEEALPDAKEFDHLKEHYEKHLRLNAPPSLPTSFLSFSSSLTKMMGTQFHSDSQSQGKLDDLGDYDPSVQVPVNDQKSVEMLMGLRSVEHGKMSD